MLIRKILVLICLMAVFTSCHKEASSGYTYFTNGTGYMSANINGSTWSATTGYAQASSTTSIHLYCSQNSVSYMNIVLDQYYGAGTYTLGGFNSATFYDGTGVQYTATSGSLTVTADDGTNITGTFYFSGVGTSGGGGSISVVNGNFYLQR